MLASKEVLARTIRGETVGFRRAAVPATLAIQSISHIARLKRPR